MGCPCCGEGPLLTILERVGLDGREHEIAECLGCHAYINYSDLAAALRAAENIVQFQAQSAENFYGTAPDPDVVAREVENSGRLLCHLLSQSSCGRAVFLDFGAGTGFMAGAATSLFRKVLAVEPSVGVLAAAHPHLPNPERIEPLPSLDDLAEPVDAIFAWHVLEHLPHLHTELARLVSFLKPRGNLFFQVPMYDYREVFDGHCTFLNKPSCQALCAKVGLVPVSIEFDRTNNFLTCVARRDEAGAPAHKKRPPRRGRPRP